MVCLEAAINKILRSSLKILKKIMKMIVETSETQFGDET